MEKRPWFLGPKGENSDVLEHFLLEALRDYVGWRRNFHPEDERIMQKKGRRSLEFQESLDLMDDRFSELLARMKDSLPFFSSRYIAHMTSETLIPANLGYFLGMLYNQNNVTSEASPVTTQLEHEAIMDLVDMIGYDHGAWGHITADGSIANFEALWVARNQTYFPLAARRVAEQYDLSVGIKTIGHNKEVDIRTMTDDIGLLNLFDPRRAPDLREALYAAAEARHLNLAQFDEDLFDAGLSGAGLNSDEIKYPPATIFVSRAAHYSIRKMVEALGLGRKNIVTVEVDDQFTIDVADLEAKIEAHIGKSVIMMVIPIVGTTEAGAVDPLHKIVELRERKLREGKCCFLIHTDAAYGGYAKTVSKDILPSHVVEAFNAMKSSDSITIDPHKMGYIPYPAGSILFRDKRVRNFVACNAPYVFKGGKEDDEKGYLKFIGQFILEGSKPGSAASACWLAHRCVPLNPEGYGKIIGDTIGAIVALKSRLSNNKRIGKYIQFLMEPDLNVLCFRIHFPIGPTLEEINGINRKIYLSFQEGQPFSETLEPHVEVRRFILSETSLRIGDYPFLKSKLALADCGEDDSVTFLRICLMNPYSRTLFEKFEKSLEEKVVAARKLFRLD